MSQFVKTYLEETVSIINEINPARIENIAQKLVTVRENKGRIFFLGVGGSAANCAHAVNDFRKICGFEAYAPTDNVSELTARTNDEGWDSIFSEWLKGSNLNSKDAIFILSVGGGNAELNVSPNLVKALDLAKSIGSTIIGIVGKDGGHTAKLSDDIVVIPTVNPINVTPHTEAFQGVVWHLLVSHPDLKKVPTKWETLL
jgi:D-sedoheptulose 7-phosphate isomerase